MGNASSINFSSEYSRFSSDGGCLSSSSPSSGFIQRKPSSFLEEPICVKHTERGEATLTASSVLRFAASEMQGWRSHMEDKHVLCPALAAGNALNDHYLFAVFDGHGGNFTSQYCGANLVKTLTSRDEWKAYLKLPKANTPHTRRTRGDVHGLKLLKAALSSTFLTLDAQILDAQKHRRVEQISELESVLIRSLGVHSVTDSQFREFFHKEVHANELVQSFAKTTSISSQLPLNLHLERSGSTGVVVLITPTHIVCANAGDSRALLCRKGQPVPLSFDHKPFNDVEEARVNNAGGSVRGGRVDGDLAVSRSFGDFAYKLHTSLDAINQRVTVYPDILVHTRDCENDEFIVLACDGVWDRLTNQECASLVRTLVKEGETDVGLVCEEIIDTSLELDSRDNMTCAIVMFPGAKMLPSSNRELENVEVAGVAKRRMEREELWGPESTVVSRAHQRLEEKKKKNKDLVHSQKMKQQALVQQNQQQQQQQRELQQQPIKAHQVTAQASKMTGLKHQNVNENCIMMSKKFFRPARNAELQVQ